MRSFLRVWLGIGVIATGLGIALLIVAFASGARWENAWEESTGEDVSFTTLNESYKSVEKLKMDIGFGEVKIKKGNEFSISAENILDGELKSYVEDGTWYINQEEGREANFFGVHFPLRRVISWGDHDTPKITVTLPEDFVAADAVIEIGAGTLTADELNATEAEFKVDAGTMEIQKLSVTNESTYTVGTGSMSLREADVKDITVDCGVGHIKIDGTVDGDNNIKCGVGTVVLNLDGSRDEYNYDVSCDIGSVEIDGKRYHDIRGELIHNESADGSLDLNCDIGKISVEFQ